MKRLVNSIFSKFKKKMQTQLDLNDDRYPERVPHEGWYVQHFHNQVDLLITAIYTKNKKEIIHRAVNVANYAMFMAYWYGRLLDKE